MDDFKITYFIFMVVVNFFIYKSIISTSNRSIAVDVREVDTSPTDSSIDFNQIDEKLILISINGFRSLLFLITSVCILAVDFRNLFPLQHSKSHRFGTSLMDIGVGFFILCHSMRLIRNSSTNDSFTETSFKK